MKFFFILFIALSVFTTNFAKANAQASDTTRAVPEPYVPATINGTSVGANLLYVTGGALVVSAIAAAIIISTHNDKNEVAHSH